MDDVISLNLNSVAASHVAIAQCVEAFARLPDISPRRDRLGFAELLDEQFRELCQDIYGLSPEEQHDLRWIWAALRKTLRSPTLERFEPQSSTTQ